MPRAEWDAVLARLGGHPLQSTLWGEARRAEDGLASHYLSLRNEAGEPVWMARAEERAITPFLKLAWIPRGPVCAPGCAASAADIRRTLKAAGFSLAVTDEWRDIAAAPPPPDRIRTRTIWIDLSVGTERLWLNLEGSRRTGAKRAWKSGVTVEQAHDERTIAEFHQMCRDISTVKGFRLNAGSTFITKLLGADESAPVGAHLFVAKQQGNLCAGAFILRCGSSVHYMWGGTIRAYSKLCPGEAVQWAVMEWAASIGCSRYDLEGIAPAANPGTYAFKKTLGGREVDLAGRQVIPVSVTGQALGWLVGRGLRAGVRK